MDNIIGIAKSYLEERGIDTSDMTIEEIIAMYNELIGEEEAEVEETPAEENEPEAEEEKSELVKLLEENQDVIAGLNDEQKELFDKIVALAK